MKRYSVNLIAGAPVPLALGGRFFVMDSAPTPILVEFFGGNGVKREEELAAAQAADWATPENGFAAIKLTSAVNQTVTFYIARGNTGSNRGSYDVVDRAARLLGVVYGNLGQLAQIALGGVNALQVTERGFTYGASFASVTALAAATNENPVTPAANANGLIVWRSHIVTVCNTAAAFTQLALIAKASAPASAIDGDVLLVAISNNSTSAGEVVSAEKLERPVLVAAGKGLYFRNSSATAESAAAYRTLQYTLL